MIDICFRIWLGSVTFASGTCSTTLRPAFELYMDILSRLGNIAPCFPWRGQGRPECCCQGEKISAMSGAFHFSIGASSAYVFRREEQMPQKNLASQPPFDVTASQARPHHRLATPPPLHAKSRPFHQIISSSLRLLLCHLNSSINIL